MNWPTTSQSFASISPKDSSSGAVALPISTSRPPRRSARKRRERGRRALGLAEQVERAVGRAACGMADGGEILRRIVAGDDGRNDARAEGFS